MSTKKKYEINFLSSFARARKKNSQIEIYGKLIIKNE